MSKNHTEVILASASAARKLLLEQLGFVVSVQPTHCSEELFCEDPKLYTEILAKRKMSCFLDYYGEPAPNSAVITADTCIFFKNSIIGKPLNRDEALLMLENFSGESHRVYSAAAVYNPSNRSTSIVSDIAEVSFFPLTPMEINSYIETGEWKGAAGAYRIQNQGLRLISAINGSYFTIAGLPIHGISGILRSRCNVI